MERLSEHRNTSGLSGNALRMWGLAMMAAGVAGRSIIQNRIFGLGTITGQELLAIMEQDPAAMYLAAIALVLQAVEACAVCIFAFLLTEGFRHTGSLKAYATRVAVLAVISEIPYNIAVCGKWLDLRTRNPVFGILIAMAMLWYFRKYEGFKPLNVIYKVVAFIGAMLWSLALGVESGVCLMPIVASLWAFRNKSQFRSFAGAAAAVLCSLISPFYMVTPMVFMLIHFYNGEKGESNKAFHYLVYPVCLIAFAVIGAVVLK